jgi:secreted trypsin-like serine protease
MTVLTGTEMHSITSAAAKAEPLAVAAAAKSIVLSINNFKQYLSFDLIGSKMKGAEIFSQ